jgi:hypothetical protein
MNLDRSIIRSLTPQQAAGNALAIAVQALPVQKESTVSEKILIFGKDA